MSRKRVTISLDRDYLKRIDKARGLIPRSTYINETLKDLYAPAEPSKAPAGTASTTPIRDVPAHE